MIHIKNKYNNIILVLSIILSIFVLYITCRTFVIATSLPLPSHTVQTVDPKDEDYIFNNITPTEVTYTANKQNLSLNGISNAELTYEYVTNDGRPFYNALFSKSIPNRSNIITNIDKVPDNSFPKINYIDIKELPDKYRKAASSIFVSLYYNLSSNFIYENGLYYHFRDKYRDIDGATLRPIAVSNVVIQFVSQDVDINTYKISGNGKGLLFCGGKVIDIKWNKEKTNPIKVVDEQGTPISLIKGSTWWIVLHENSSVAYN